MSAYIRRRVLLADQARIEYEYDDSIPGALLVVDLVDARETDCRSLTAERVAFIADLDSLGILRGRRVFYRDSGGAWDEMLHQDGKFVHFRIYGAEDRAAALAALVLGKPGMQEEDTRSCPF